MDNLSNFLREENIDKWKVANYEHPFVKVALKRFTST